MKKFFALLLAVLMLGSFATVAFAAEAEDGSSPSGGEEHKIVIESELQKVGGANIAYHEDGSFTITPIEVSGYEFETYKITKLVASRSVEEGYDILKKEGSAWTIRAYTDLEIIVLYKDAQGGGSGNNDPGNQSPNTGDNVLAYTALILFGLCGVAVASKKLSKSH